MPTVQVLKIAKWDSLHFMYKVGNIGIYGLLWLHPSLHGAYINQEDFSTSAFGLGGYHPPRSAEFVISYESRIQ